MTNHFEQPESPRKPSEPLIEKRAEHPDAGMMAYRAYLLYHVQLGLGNKYPIIAESAIANILKKNPQYEGREEDTPVAGAVYDGGRDLGGPDIRNNVREVLKRNGVKPEPGDFVILAKNDGVTLYSVEKGVSLPNNEGVWADLGAWKPGDRDPHTAALERYQTELGRGESDS